MSDDDVYVSPHPDVPAAPVEAVINAWGLLRGASDPVSSAGAMIRLANAMDDMRSHTVFRDFLP